VSSSSAAALDAVVAACASGRTATDPSSWASTDPAGAARAPSPAPSPT
jgi:hypothetical protein